MATLPDNGPAYTSHSAHPSVHFILIHAFTLHTSTYHSSHSLYTRQSHSLCIHSVNLIGTPLVLLKYYLSVLHRHISIPLALSLSHTYQPKCPRLHHVIPRPCGTLTSHPDGGCFLHCVSGQLRTQQCEHLPHCFPRANPWVRTPCQLHPSSRDHHTHYHAGAP